MTLPLAPFLTVWTVLALNVASPGPNIVNTITTAMGSGRGPGLASAVAVGFGIGGWCLGMTLGMAAAFQAAPQIRIAMTLLGAALLFWFAWRYARAAWAGRRGTMRTLAGRSGLSAREAFLRSLSINATNPKALTTWIVILSLFPVARASAGDIALLATGAATLAVAIHAVYALAFSTPPAARFYQRAAPLINATVALFFSAIACKLALGLLP